MPECKLTDRAYLTLILSQQWPAEAHRPEVMYDVFLPWLADGTLPRKCVDDPCADYRTAPRASTSSAHYMLETARASSTSFPFGLTIEPNVALSLVNSLFNSLFRYVLQLHPLIGLKHQLQTNNR